MGHSRPGEVQKYGESKSLASLATAVCQLMHPVKTQAPMYYRGAHAAILVYDITDLKSFKDLKSWLEGVSCCFTMIYELTYPLQS